MKVETQEDLSEVFESHAVKPQSGTHMLWSPEGFYSSGYGFSLKRSDPLLFLL